MFSDHQGIDDAFLEKASVTYYWYEGKWLDPSGRGLGPTLRQTANWEGGLSPLCDAQDGFGGTWNQDIAPGAVEFFLDG